MPLSRDRLLGQLEMHAVDGTSGEPRTPEPAVVVKEWDELQNTSISLRFPLRDDGASKEQIECGAPAMVREGIRVGALNTDAQHARGLQRCHDIRYLLLGPSRAAFSDSTPLLRPLTLTGPSSTPETILCLNAPLAGLHSLVFCPGTPKTAAKTIGVGTGRTTHANTERALRARRRVEGTSNNA